jgi:hypothetical protein
MLLKRRDSPGFSVFLERRECGVRDETGISVKTGLFMLYQTTCCVPLTSTIRRSHSSLGRFATFLGACACVEIDFDPPDVCCAVLPPLRVIAAALSPVPLRMAWKKAVHVMVSSRVR